MSAIDECRSCGSPRLEAVLSLGRVPLANALPEPDEPDGPRYPLDVVRCLQCDLVQITETVPPERLFREYAYFSSFSETFLEHARTFANRTVERLELAGDSLVVEAASNDGYLLRFFAELGVPVLGIEPARNVAAVATAAGIETVPEFLDGDLARSLVATRGRCADLVVANNVLAHVADLHGFVEGLRTLAGDSGLVSVEVPYLCEFVQRLEFDTVYHEHLCYYSLTSLARLFAAHGLSVVDVERLPVHGGSIRVLARAEDQDRDQSPRVAELLRQEQEWGVSDQSRYATFAREVEELRHAIGSLVRELAATGARIAGYGAAAKAVVLTNTCGLDASLVQYVVDRNPYKQGRLLPGVRIPVRPPEALLESPPDYLVLFVWNIADEVIAQQQRFAEAGGRFIVPIPWPRVVGEARASARARP